MEKPRSFSELFNFQPLAPDVEGYRCSMSPLHLEAEPTVTPDKVINTLIEPNVPTNLNEEVTETSTEVIDAVIKNAPILRRSISMAEPRCDRRFSDLFHVQPFAPDEEGYRCCMSPLHEEAEPTVTPDEVINTLMEPNVPTNLNEEVAEASTEVIDAVIEDAPTLRRSNRRRISTSIPQEDYIPIKPVKLTAKSSDQQIVKYYLDTKVRRVNQSLETIYEEPQVVNNREVTMSSRKFRRLLHFDGIAANKGAKIKKRKMKVKKLGLKNKFKKVSMNFLKNKLEELD